MLPKYYKFKVINDCGQSISGVTLTWTPYKPGPVYAANVQPILSQTIANGSGYTSTTAIDNTSALNSGGEFILQATLAGAPSGNQAIRVYIVPSPDNTTFEDQSSVLVAAFYAGAAGAGVWAGKA